MGACPVLSVVHSDERVEITRQLDAVEIARAAMQTDGELTVNVGPSAIAALARTLSETPAEVEEESPAPLPSRTSKTTLPPMASMLPAVRSSRPPSDPLLPVAMPAFQRTAKTTPVPASNSSIRPVPQYIRRHAPPPSVLKKMSETPEDKLARVIVVGIWSVAALLLVTLAVLVH